MWVIQPIPGVPLRKKLLLMTILLIALIVLAGLIVFFLTVAIFLKKEYTVEREIVIKKPKKIVFDYVKLIKNQTSYNKWTMIDPNSKIEYHGTDGTVGFVGTWESGNKQVGKGEQELTKVEEGQRIELKLHFIKPIESTSASYMVTESVSADETRLKWGFNGKMKYPMNAMILIMNLPEMLGKDLDVSLGNLKTILEKQ